MKKTKINKTNKKILSIIILCTICFFLGFFTGEKKCLIKLSEIKMENPVLEKPEEFTFYNTLSLSEEKAESNTNTKQLLPEAKKEIYQEENTKNSLFTIQTGAFTERKSAEELMRKFKVKGYKPYLSSIVSKDGKIWYRVRIGIFEEIEAAQKLAIQITREEKLTSFVTETN